MKKNRPPAKPRISRRSWCRTLSAVTLAFAAIVFATLALDRDEAQAQETPAAKTKNPDAAARSKGLPVAASLTHGKKVDSAALARLIDQEINKRIKAEGAKSSGLCSDEEFIRRVHLDLTGVIPSADKVTAFLSSKDPQKRAKLIDELIDDPRFGAWLAESWAIQLMPRDSNNRLLNQKPLETWLAAHFNKNTPLDKVVYELITVSGEIAKNPAGVYFVANPTVDKITDNVTRMFLGVQLQCAQCHNHPFTDWKQTEYWAMAAFFMKTRVNGNPQMAAKKGITLAVSETAKFKAGKKGGGLPESAKIVPARFLQGDQPKIDTPELRPTLAKWMTAADNKFFARAMVNRFWYQLYGRGLVNPVDDMHDDNAASHPELLATLTEQFKLHGFDMKYLIRAICTSEAYQRSSISLADVASIDPELYSRREIRVMAPEQMYDSLTVILGAAPRFDAPGKGAKKGGPATPRGAFINFFRVDDANPLEYQNGIPQALRLMNSPFTNRAEAIAADITKDTQAPAEAIERVFLTALSRRPTQAEIQRLTKYVNRPDSTPRSSYGDILWALLNSSEFVLNH